MSQLYMLDTNMASYLLKGKSPATRQRMLSLQVGELACISAVTEAEMLYGIAKSGIGEQRMRLLNWFLLLVAVQPWGREEAAAYGPLRARQEAMGKTLGPLDMQIAAHAISLGAVLVTNDKAFHQVPDLVGVDNWATDL
ncbi:type II toxin-antitoxin system VapC family toxin [Granulicella sibirica]|uniref:Ribonuclease VapC n=1 Tax=Granulicella sibirica TaxID=2479048 RepID=A0A4Q0ST18_9BACT|nr:type II toxin-antitoxin system VapC family toxin [Granulicella sibirica]RXH54063.1 VapC toxin protein [Granulicella sibirica]